jgi:plastocyanin
VASAATLTIDVRNARNQPLRDAVVYAIPDGKTLPLAKKTAVMDQKNRTFIPHILPIQTGTSVRFPNSDDIRHQVYSFSTAKTFQLPLYTGTPSNPIVFDKPGVATLGCNIHDRMSAYIVVVDTPHFQTTGGNGRATLADLGAGKYTVHVWHPQLRANPVSVTLTAAQRHPMTISLR